MYSIPSSNPRPRRRVPAAAGFSTAALAIACVLAGALASAPDAHAQGTTTLKIAVLDTEQVLLSSQTGKKAMEELKTLRDQKTQEGKAKEAELADLQKRLTEGRLSLSEEKLSELQKQYEDKVIEMRRFQDDANRDLGKKRDDLLAKVDAQVMPVINAYGAEMGYDLIFRKFDSGLIFANAKVDITQDVIQRLDAGGK